MLKSSDAAAELIKQGVVISDEQITLNKLQKQTKMFAQAEQLSFQSARIFLSLLKKRVNRNAMYAIEDEHDKESAGNDKWVQLMVYGNEELDAGRPVQHIMDYSEQYDRAEAKGGERPLKVSSRVIFEAGSESESASARHGDGKRKLAALPAPETHVVDISALETDGDEDGRLESIVEGLCSPQGSLSVSYSAAEMLRDLKEFIPSNKGQATTAEIMVKFGTRILTTDQSDTFKDVLQTACYCKKTKAKKGSPQVAGAWKLRPEIARMVIADPKSAATAETAGSGGVQHAAGAAENTGGGNDMRVKLPDGKMVLLEEAEQFTKIFKMVAKKTASMLTDKCNVQLIAEKIWSYIVSFTRVRNTYRMNKSTTHYLNFIRAIEVLKCMLHTYQISSGEVMTTELLEKHMDNVKSFELKGQTGRSMVAMAFSRSAVELGCYTHGNVLSGGFFATFPLNPFTGLATPEAMRFSAQHPEFLPSANLQSLKPRKIPNVGDFASNAERRKKELQYLSAETAKELVQNIGSINDVKMIGTSVDDAIQGIMDELEALEADNRSSIAPTATASPAPDPIDLNFKDVEIDMNHFRTLGLSLLSHPPNLIPLFRPNISIKPPHCITSKMNITYMCVILYDAVFSHTDGQNRRLVDAFLLVPEAVEEPEFYETVEHPMDLLTIKGKIEADHYNHVLECLNDFDLMFNNAREYNEAGDIIFEDATMLRMKLHETYDNLGIETPLVGDGDGDDGDASAHVDASPNDGELKRKDVEEALYVQVQQAMAARPERQDGVAGIPPGLETHLKQLSAQPPTNPFFETMAEQNAALKRSKTEAKIKVQEAKAQAMIRANGGGVARPEQGIVDVTLDTSHGSTTIGMKLMMVPGTGKGAVVRSVDPGGLADQTNKVFAGQMITHIHGIYVVELSLREIGPILMKSSVVPLRLKPFIRSDSASGAAGAPAHTPQEQSTEALAQPLPLPAPILTTLPDKDGGADMVKKGREKVDADDEGGADDTSGGSGSDDDDDDSDDDSDDDDDDSDDEDEKAEKSMYDISMIALARNIARIEKLNPELVQGKPVELEEMLRNGVNPETATQAGMLHRLVDATNKLQEFKAYRTHKQALLAEIHAEKIQLEAIEFAQGALLNTYTQKELAEGKADEIQDMGCIQPVQRKCPLCQGSFLGVHKVCAVCIKFEERLGNGPRLALEKTGKLAELSDSAARLVNLATSTEKLALEREEVAKDGPFSAALKQLPFSKIPKAVPGDNPIKALQVAFPGIESIADMQNLAAAASMFKRGLELEKDAVVANRARVAQIASDCLAPEPLPLTPARLRAIADSKSAVTPSDAKTLQIYGPSSGAKSSPKQQLQLQQTASTSASASGHAGDASTQKALPSIGASSSVGGSAGSATAGAGGETAEDILAKATELIRSIEKKKPSARSANFAEVGASDGTTLGILRNMANPETAAKTNGTLRATLDVGGVGKPLNSTAEIERNVLKMAEDARGKPNAVTRLNLCQTVKIITGYNLVTGERSMSWDIDGRKACEAATKLNMSPPPVSILGDYDLEKKYYCWKPVLSLTDGKGSRVTGQGMVVGPCLEKKEIPDAALRVECHFATHSRLAVLKTDLAKTSARPTGPTPLKCTPLHTMRQAHMEKIFSTPNLNTLDEVSIMDNSLASVPAGLCKLTKLKLIHFQHNHLTDDPLSFIPEVANLTNLEKITLCYNSFTRFPGVLCEMTWLKQIEVTGNDINFIPAEVGNLSNLEALALGGNNLSTLPIELFELRKLVTLELFNNCLVDLPDALGNLKDLEHLDLAGNKLKELPAEGIEGLDSLMRLRCSRNQLGVLPAELGFLENLQQLHFEQNKIVHVPAELGLLQNLHTLLLDHNKITQLPADIGLLPKLMVLLLDSNEIATLPTALAALVVTKRDKDVSPFTTLRIDDHILKEPSCRALFDQLRGADVQVLDLPTGRTAQQVRMLKRRAARSSPSSASSRFLASQPAVENEFSALAASFLNEDQRDLDDLLAELGELGDNGSDDGGGGGSGGGGSGGGGRDGAVGSGAGGDGSGGLGGAGGGGGGGGGGDGDRKGVNEKRGEKKKKKKGKKKK